MLTLAQLNDQYHAATAAIDTKPRGSKAWHKAHDKAHKAFMAWFSADCKQFHDGKKALEPLSNLLSKEMINYLANKGHHSFERMEYDRAQALEIYNGGEKLVTFDTGFCQSYLIRQSDGIYFCSITTLIRFTQ